MSLNIQIIRTRRPHWGKFSGINQFLKYIDHNKYHMNIYVASDNDDDFPIKNIIVQRWLRSIVQRNGMQYYKLSDLTAEIKIFRKCLWNKIDVIHFMDGEHSAQYLPWLCKLPRKVRPKIIATYHQPPELLDSLIMKDIILRLDCITLVSPEQVSYFKKFIAPEKIHLILHGIDTNFFKPGSISKEKDKFKCITVGHWLRDFKAIREVAEKLTSYKNIEFHVVTSNLTGPKVTGLEGSTNIVLYRNTIDDTRLLELYQQSDILFLPLLQSTANNALLEGIACGLPVISTYLPSVKAYLPGREAILIKDNEPEKLVEAILHLAHSPEDCKDLSFKARKRAEELDWRNITPQYEGVYSK